MSDSIRILPLHNLDAGLTEGILQREEEERAHWPGVSTRGLQLLQLLALLPLQRLLIHDEGLQVGVVGVCHVGLSLRSFVCTSPPVVANVILVWL